MKSLLLFPPSASQTYVPAGLAALSGYVKSHAPDIILEIADLNIAGWNLLANRRSEFGTYRDFVQGRTGDFYDSKQYIASHETFTELNAEMEAMRLQALSFVEGQEAETGLTVFLDALLAPVLSEAPDFTGISVLYPKQVAFALALALRLRERLAGRPCRIVLGGAMMTALDAGALLKACPFIDAAVPGEGEAALLDACQGRTLRTYTPLPPESFPFPDFTFADLNACFNPKPVLPALFSRGCAWRRCGFCAHNNSYGRYRRKTAAVFTEELSKLSEKHSVRHFYFADQYVDAASLSALSDEIIRRGLDIRFHAMGRPSTDYTPELLERLYRAGCRWISWGAESGSQRLLDLVNKGVDASDLPRLIQNTHRAGISNLLMLIFGLPGSADPDYEATVRLLEQNSDAVDAVTSSRFQLFLGTPFARDPKKYGIKMTGRERLFTRSGIPVYSGRLAHDGSGRAADEIERWERFRMWTRGERLLERLWSEHYLLYVSR